MANCRMCKKEMDVPRDVGSEDCGGDCTQCMADSGDMDCIRALAEEGWPLYVAMLSEAQSGD